VIEDGPQGPSDDESARKISLSRGECVSGRGSLEEEARRKIGVMSEAIDRALEPETHRARKTKTLVQTPG